MSLPTPDYRIEDESIYPPAEDTFLLLDALEMDRRALLQLHPPLVAVEIGSGSGVVSAFLRQLLLPTTNATSEIQQTTISTIFSLCTDLNRRALECTRRTLLTSMSSQAVRNTSSITTQSNDIAMFDCVECDLLTPLAHRLTKQVDVMLFNPPYVPTETEAQEMNELYYAGGERGRIVIDRALAQVAALLSPQGVLYMVVMRENNPAEIIDKYSSKLEGEVLIERRCGIEYLFVLKFRRRDSSLK